MTQDKISELTKSESLIVSYLIKRISFFSYTLLIGLAMVKSTYAQNIIVEQQKQQHLLTLRNSISLSSFVLLGSLQVNYERLLGKRHGLVAEGYYAFAGTSSDSWTMGVSYRYHLKPSLKGLFFNGFYRYSPQFKNTYKIKEDNNTYTYRLKTQLNVLGLGIGNRWQGKNGLAVVIRGGYGYQIQPHYNWSPSLPKDSADKSSREALLGLDLELSVGYAF